MSALCLDYRTISQVVKFDVGETQTKGRLDYRTISQVVKLTSLLAL